MDNRMLTAAGAVLIIGALTSCSSPDPNPPPPGSLPVGTAQVMIGGKDIGTTNAVTCQTLGALTILTTGDPAAGTTSTLDGADAVNAESVVIRNLGGFSGSYWNNLQGKANVDVTGRTRLITGTATGYTADNPDVRATQPFTIKVSC